MEKPNNYDTTTAASFGDFETLEPGGYICQILKAEATQSKSGKEMLILYFDIREGEHKGYFKRTFDRMKEKNPDAKWKGTYYQLTTGNSTQYFKGMITAIEESNRGFKFDFDETKLDGKMFGGAIGLEQYENNGKTGMSPKLKFTVSVESVKKGITAPKDKMLEGIKKDDSLDDLAGFSLMADDESDVPF